jgi:hypothetical protein
MQSLASVGLRRRPTLLLACLRSLTRVPQPVADSLANAGAWPLRHLISEYHAGSTFRLLVWGIEFLPVVSTAAFRRDLAVPPLIRGPFPGTGGTR